MDIFDRAQDLAQAERDAALASHRLAHPAPRGDWRTASARRCTAECCGEPIPEARRRAIPGVQFCMECQSVFDRLERQRKRGHG